MLLHVRVASALLLICSLAACHGTNTEPCLAHRGDVIITDAAGWKTFVDEGCSVVEGDLIVEFFHDEAVQVAAPALVKVTESLQLRGAGAGLGGVSLPNLEAIGGGLYLSDSDTLSELSLPVLASVGGDLVVGHNAGLGLVDLPALTTIGGDVSVAFNDGLVAVRLPRLAAAPGDLSLLGNGQLAWLDARSLTSVLNIEVSLNGGALSLDFPALEQVGLGVDVHSNPMLVACRFPALTSLPSGGLTFRDNTTLRTLEFSALTEVWSGVQIELDPALTTVSLPSLQVANGEISVHFLPSLSSVYLPALRTAGSLRILDNAALASLSLPVLASTSLLYVISNPVLPECQPLAVKDRLVAAGGLPGDAWQIHDNDAVATCGP